MSIRSMERWLWTLLLVMACTSAAANQLEQRRGELRNLYAQSEQLFERGKYRDAIAIARRAAAAAPSVFGSEHAYTATLLDHLGAMLVHAGEYIDAQPVLEQALDMRGRRLGPRHAETARTQRHLALLHTYGNDYSKAEVLGLQALSALEATLGPRHPETARSLLQLALLYSITADYTKAERFNLRALSISERALGPEHPRTAMALNLLGRLYMKMGDYTKSAPLLQRALAIAERARGPSHPETGRILRILADLKLQTGDYGKVGPLLQRVQAIERQALSSRSADAGRTLWQLGGFHVVTGSYSKAEPALQLALETLEAALGTHHIDYAGCMSVLGILFSITGAQGKAEVLNLRAIATYEKLVGTDHPDTAAALQRLALTYYFTGAYEKALQLAERAQRINESTLGENNLGTAHSAQMLGVIYVGMGDSARGETWNRRALEIRRRSLQPAHIDLAHSLEVLGILYHLNGAYADARATHLEALTVRERALGPNHPNVASSLQELAWIDWALDKPTVALPLLLRAQRIRGQNSGRFIATGSHDAKQAYLQHVAGAVFEAVTFSLAHPKRGGLALGLNAVLQLKGQALDSAAGSIARLRQSSSAEDQELFVKLADVAGQLSMLMFQPAASRVADTRTRIEDVSQRREALESELSKRTRLLGAPPASARLGDVRRAIPSDALLIEWFRYRPFNPKGSTVKEMFGQPPRYVAYVLSRTGVPAAIDLGAAENIEAQVHALRLAVSNPLRGDVKQRAAELSRRIIAPLYPHLRGRRHLLLSPDGALNLVPMAALLDERGEYLQKRFEITYLTSGRDLLHIAEEAPAHGPAVVVTNPDFGPVDATRKLSATLSRSVDVERGGLTFVPLPATADEGLILQQWLGSGATRLLTRIEASEDNLKRLSRPSILHIATHGFFLSDQELVEEMEFPTAPLERSATRLREDPLLRSGLALSGANLRRAGGEDGILTALEAAQLDLRGTQLVVLSACETGVGEVRNGEGVYGLRRALALAGAQTQVTSLWRVADDTTRQFMASYYERLFKGEGRSAALRAAQQAVTAVPGRSHPYFWAGFISIGDWTPMAHTSAH